MLYTSQSLATIFSLPNLLDFPRASRRKRRPLLVPSSPNFIYKCFNDLMARSSLTPSVSLPHPLPVKEELHTRSSSLLNGPAFLTASTSTLRVFSNKEIGPCMSCYWNMSLERTYGILVLGRELGAKVRRSAIYPQRTSDHCQTSS